VAPATGIIRRKVFASRKALVSRAARPCGWDSHTACGILPGEEMKANVITAPRNHRKQYPKRQPLTPLRIRSRSRFAVQMTRNRNLLRPTRLPTRKRRSNDSNLTPLRIRSRSRFAVQMTRNRNLLRPTKLPTRKRRSNDSNLTPLRIRSRSRFAVQMTRNRNLLRPTRLPTRKRRSNDSHTACGILPCEEMTENVLATQRTNRK